MNHNCVYPTLLEFYWHLGAVSIKHIDKNINCQYQNEQSDHDNVKYSLVLARFGKETQSYLI